MFKGILITKDENAYSAQVTSLDDRQLPEGDVTVRVDYSSLNYKDALAITGNSPIIRHFPMVPGIDLAGSVERSNSPHFSVGDQVLLNGWGVGEKHWGGLAQKARVSSQWLLPLPPSLTTQQAMSFGTAGYTAMLAVMALERQGITPISGDIIVTGATGGVGSLAVVILTQLGYSVIASTGKLNESSYLTDILGAKEVIDRAELSDLSRPLQKERWIAGIDTVGSNTLVNVCAATSYGGVIAACGLAQGMDFHGSVAPFILRGITLVGIDSVMCSKNDRIAAWDRLAKFSSAELLTNIIKEVSLIDAISAATVLLEGKIRGRLVVNVNQCMDKQP